jgi:hypothetical protein
LAIANWLIADCGLLDCGLLDCREGKKAGLHCSPAFLLSDPRLAHRSLGEGGSRRP